MRELPVIDRRKGPQAEGKCPGYYDRFHHDGGNEHLDRYHCERALGHEGEHFDYPDKKIE